MPRKNGAPLNKKTVKGESLEFKLLADTELDVFSTSRKQLVSPTTLAISRHGYKFTLDIDCVRIPIRLRPARKETGR